MTDLFDNPMGTDGFEFVEYAAPEPELLRALFEQMGFVCVARHRSKDEFIPGSSRRQRLGPSSSGSRSSTYLRIMGFTFTPALPVHCSTHRRCVPSAGLTFGPTAVSREPSTPTIRTLTTRCVLFDTKNLITPRQAL